MKELTSYNRVAGYLNKLFDLLNQEFFEGTLSRPTITIQSTPKAYGHFSRGMTHGFPRRVLPMRSISALGLWHGPSRKSLPHYSTRWSTITAMSMGFRTAPEEEPITTGVFGTAQRHTV